MIRQNSHKPWDELEVGSCIAPQRDCAGTPRNTPLIVHESHCYNESIFDAAIAGVAARAVI